MNQMYFKRAKILSYDAAKRTAKVHIHGLTDGASEGLTATFAYPVGDDDRDTERQIVLGNDVYVFFEDGDEYGYYTKTAWRSGGHPIHWHT